MNLINNNQKIYIALTSIYGVGIPTSKKILNNLNISQDLKVSELNGTEGNSENLPPRIVKSNKLNTAFW